jgi:Gpi18-like mannosyltransferase
MWFLWFPKQICQTSMCGALNLSIKPQIMFLRIWVVKTDEAA